MSLHINNNYAKKRGIGKKLLLTIRAIMQEEHVDLVAGDFHGAAWGLLDGNNLQPSSILEEAFADTDLPMSLGATPLWSPGASPCEWTDVCDFFWASGLVWKMEGPSAWSFHYSPRDPRLPSKCKYNTSNDPFSRCKIVQ